MDYAITMIWYLILFNGDTYFETATQDFIIIKTGVKKKNYLNAVRFPI